jgi:hypothetical protein
MKTSPQRDKKPKKNLDPLAVDRAKRLEEILKELFPERNLREIEEVLKVPRSSLSRWKHGASIDCDHLAKLAKEGADVHYILTGEPGESRKEPPQVDPLNAITAAPAACPNHGLCNILAKHALLLRGLLSAGMLESGLALEAVEAAMHVVARHHADGTKQKASEACVESPNVEAKKNA